MRPTPAAGPVGAGTDRGAPACSAYRLPVIPYLRLRTTFEAREPGRLPEYHGSLLRGAFGHALRRTVCTLGARQACETCRLRRVCVQTRLFETFIEGEAPPFLGGLATPPRPFVIEPRSERREFAAGDPLEFDLLLLGRAVDLAPYALLALERMAASGLGSRRARFALTRVAVPAARGEGWEALVERDVVAAGAAAAPRHTAGSEAGESIHAPGRAVLRFLTPARLKVGGRLTGAAGVRDLVFAMLRRVLELAHFYVPGAAIDWNFVPFLARTAAVRVAASDLRWRDWCRFSRRQRTKMTLGGFVGGMTLDGDLGPFVPLLRAAEVVHVGKAATFGLGRVAVELD